MLALAVAAPVADDEDAAAAVAVTALREGERPDRGRDGARRRGGAAAAVVAVGEDLRLRDLEHRRALRRLVELGRDGRGRRHVLLLLLLLLIYCCWVGWCFLVAMARESLTSAVFLFYCKWPVLSRDTRTLSCLWDSLLLLCNREARVCVVANFAPRARGGKGSRFMSHLPSRSGRREK